ncbi:MAG: CDP-alcohol phosphatidyltransferase family protein [Nanoarchaeota archaeon]|nr:CDP-alcohol phosphatidyltransferase family protein [Nanoarchaeota archaeon]MBU1005587.1 CDP-alcohol phosphatidyltransferase family protein [Nanoarchaeota archaeon]MBU1945973.1 CDP-alcohol phosphatidyltransferase family protein [Nanoarchaeota archaeon]
MSKVSWKEIKEYHRKKPKNIFLLSSYFAPYLTKLLLHTSITANQVTFFSFLFSFIAVPLIAFGDYKWTIIGSVLLQFILIMDASDGAIARIRKTTGKFSAYYGGFMHDFIPIFLIIAMSIKSYIFFDNYMFFIAGMITITAMFLTGYSRFYKDRVAVKYMLRYGKKLVSDQVVDVLPNPVMPNEDALQDKTKTKSNVGFIEKNVKRFRFMEKIIFFFNSFSHLLAFVLMLSVFNILHYALFFYAPFYIIICILKVYVEVKKGLNEYVFEDRK